MSFKLLMTKQAEHSFLGNSFSLCFFICGSLTQFNICKLVGGYGGIMALSAFS